MPVLNEKYNYKSQKNKSVEEHKEYNSWNPREPDIIKTLHSRKIQVHEVRA
jgi:hypothetical protein